MSGGLLVFGGDKDFNIIRLLKRLSARDLKFLPILYGNSGNPELTYDILNNSLKIENKEIDVNSAFIRYDVFNYLVNKDGKEQAKSHNRHLTIQGWLLSNPDIKVLNRQFFKKSKTNKIYSLRAAIETGFNVPETYVTNDLKFANSILESKSFISKEIDGGTYTQELEKFDFEQNRSKQSDYPFFIQEKLIKPELRVFRIGDKCFSFKITSDKIDYRIDSSARIEFIENDDELVKKVFALTDTLGLDFSALDFKTNSETNEPMFLEANSQPMFAAFDELCDYQITDAFIDFLTQS